MSKIYLFFFLLVFPCLITNINASSKNLKRAEKKAIFFEDEVNGELQKSMESIFGVGQFILNEVDTEKRDDGGRDLSATITLFGEAEVSLSGSYSSSKRIESLEIEFPEESTIDFIKINQLADGKLTSYLPDGFPLNVGIWVQFLGIEFGATGYAPSKLSTIIASPSNWELLGAGSFTANEIEVEFEITDPTLASREVTGTLTGTMNVGNIPLTLATALSNNTENLAIKATIEKINLKNILDATIGNNASTFLNETPDLFKAIELSTVELAVFPGAKSLNFNGESSLGSLIFDINRKAGSEKILLALKPPPSFKFSDFAAILSPLDGMNMSGSYFILTDRQSIVPAKFIDPEAEDANYAVKKGLNLVTSIELPAEVKDILKVSNITLVGTMPSDFTGINLYAELGLNMQFGDGAFSFDNVNAGLVLEKSEVEFRIGGAGSFQAGSDRVEIYGGLIVSATDQTVEVEAGLAAGGARAEKPNSCLEPQAEWKEPFDIPGVGIRGLGIRGGVGIKFPWINTLGLTGNLRLGTVSNQSKHVCGSLVAYVNVADISETMLIAEVRNLTPLSLIEAFTENSGISGGLRDALDTGIESAKLKIVPKDVELFGRTYTRGIALDSARLKLAGISGLIGFSIGESGIKAYGEMDPFVIEEGGFTFFAIEGARPHADGSRSGPSVSLGLDANDPHFKLSGSVTVLEITNETFIKVDKSGFEFETTGKILDGALGVTAHIKAGELTPTSGLYAKVAFENKLQTMLADELIKFIEEESKKSQQAYKDAKYVLEQEKSGNDFGDAFIDLASGTVDAFSEMDKGMAVAGSYVVEGLLKDALNIRKISFEGEVTSMKAKVEIEIDMTIAGSDLIEKVSVELNISEDMFIDLIVDAIGDDVIDFFGTLDTEIANAFEDLGEELETAFEDLGGYIEDGAIIVGEGLVEGAEVFGKGLIDGAEYVGTAFINLGNTMTNFFEGSTYTPPVSNGTFAGIPPNSTHIQVTVNSITVTGDEGGFYPALDLFGAVAINVSNNLYANKGATPYVYSVSARNQVEKSKGASININRTKDFIINTDQLNANSGWIQIVSLMSEWNTFDADREDLRGSANISLADLNTYGTLSNSFTGSDGDGESISISYTVRKVGSRGPVPTQDQMRAAVASNNIGEVRRLAGEGGQIRGDGMIEAAITSKTHYSMVQELIYAKNYPKTSQLELATHPNYYNPDIVKVLLNSGARASSDALLNVVNRNDMPIATLLLNNQAYPKLAHVQSAIKNDNADMIWALMRAANVQVGRNELQYAVNKGDQNLVNLFIERGANADAAMITKAIEIGNTNMVNALLKVGEADHTALQAAANKNNTDLFKTLINNRVTLVNNGPINTAIDYSNYDIIELGLKNGGSKTETLSYAISKNNKKAMELALERGANGTPALDFAVNNNDIAFFEKLVLNHSADPNLALSKAYTKGNITMGGLALKARGNASLQIAAAATEGKVDWVKLLLQFKANPDLGMSGSVNNQHVEIVGLLLDAGAKAEQPALIASAAKNKNLAIVKLLVEKGNAIAENGRTYAIANNDVTMVSYLLDKGAKATGVNLPATNGWFDMVKLLVDRGADPNEGIASSISKNYTEIAVYLLDKGAGVADYIKTSAYHGNETITAKLLEKGANPDDGTFNAAKYQHVGVMRLLIDAGGDVSKPEIMDVSVKNLQEDMIVLLLKHGGDTEFVTKKGFTYLHRVADSRDQGNLVKIFIEQKIDLEAKNKDGQTALHLAVDKKNNEASVKHLIDARADVNAQTKKGRSVLKKSNKAYKEMLEAAGAVK
ncbi:MAG: ankyrin repeat domain-containing protein [Chitinophagales bacterium]